MKRTTRYGNTDYTHDPNMKPVTHEGSNQSWSKEQDTCERLDSGIESYQSVDSAFNSIRSSYSIEQSMSNMSISSPTTNTTTTSSENINDQLHDSKIAEIHEDRYDSGFRSGSILEDSISELRKPLQTEPVEETEAKQEIEPDVLQWLFPDKDGDTYLQLAIIQKKVDMAFQIVQMCTAPAHLDMPNKNRYTALHLSVITDQPQITRCLVAYGADVRCKDKQGNTPLHIACERGLPVQVEMLTTRLEPEEDPGFRDTPLPQNVNERNYLGFTSLHLAAINNRADVIDTLINHLHCDVDMPDLKSGRTALHHAIERKNSRAVDIILRSNANIDALTYDECSPLHLAAARGLKPEASDLIEHGADLYLITRDDYDVFELAMHKRRLYNYLREAEKRYRERTLGYQHHHQPIMG